MFLIEKEPWEVNCSVIYNCRFPSSNYFHSAVFSENFYSFKCFWKNARDARIILSFGTYTARDDDPTLWLYIEYALMASIHLLMIYISSAVTRLKLIIKRLFCLCFHWGIFFSFTTTKFLEQPVTPVVRKNRGNLISDGDTILKLPRLSPLKSLSKLVRVTIKSFLQIRNKTPTAT